MPTDPNPQVTVKTEMGTSYKRLPSFRTPRDLKLSQFRELASAAALGEARPKKVFVPNLNVHRKRPEDRGETRPKDVVSPTAPRDVRDRGRGPEERGRGRGRGGRKSREFIQQSGVFSQGLAPSMKPAWGNKNYESTTTSSSVPKPKLKLNETLTVNKEEEDAMMKELLRDDFIDDTNIEPDADNAPVELPLQDYCKLEHLKVEDPFGAFGYSTCQEENYTNGIRVKPDPESNKTPGINGKIEFDPVDVHHIKPVGLSQLLSASQEKNFLFFQLPHRIPNMKVNTCSYLSSNKRSGEHRCEEEDDKASVLRDLPSGRIGTLQIRKSGRAVLVLGDVKLDVQPGTQSAFKQDLVSVNLENSTKSGNMINMGKITTRILVTPDWKNLLEKSVK